MLRWVVERELEIIGEATNHFLDIDPDIQIDNGRRVVGLRDFVIHGYEKEDNVIIWGVISKDLPKLKQQVDYLHTFIWTCKSYDLQLKSWMSSVIREMIYGNNYYEGLLNGVYCK